MKEPKIYINGGEMDHDSVFWHDESDDPIGYGFIPHDKPGFICLQRCPECYRENYAMAVISGQCCWCGFNPNLKQDDSK